MYTHTHTHLIYNLVLVLGVQQSESGIHISTLFYFLMYFYLSGCTGS